MIEDSQRCKDLIALCKGVCLEAETQPKGKQFDFFAQRVPDSVLQAIAQAVAAEQQGKLQSEFSGLLFGIATDLHYLLHQREAMAEMTGAWSSKWDRSRQLKEMERNSRRRLNVAIALDLEQIRRAEKSIKVRLPPDPFNDFDLAVSVTFVERQRRKLAEYQAAVSAPKLARGSTGCLVIMMPMVLMVLATVLALLEHNVSIRAETGVKQEPALKRPGNTADDPLAFQSRAIAELRSAEKARISLVAAPIGRP